MKYSFITQDNTIDQIGQDTKVIPTNYIKILFREMKVIDIKRKFVYNNITEQNTVSLDKTQSN